MNISVENIGKKYGKNWIFRDLTFEIPTKSRFGLTGKNGSGKSTLLQIISGFLTPSEGQVRYEGKELDIEKLSAAFIGPYTEIIEEFTLNELLSFHSQFKKPTMTIEEMAERASLPLNRVIGEFSTGMKQRTNLITAFFFENEVIFMDEPTSNLDQEGFEWWKKEISSLDKTIIIASNQSSELEICENRINL